MTQNNDDAVKDSKPQKDEKSVEAQNNISAVQSDVAINSVIDKSIFIKINEVVQKIQTERQENRLSLENYAMTFEVIKNITTDYVNLESYEKCLDIIEKTKALQQWIKAKL